MPIRHSSRSISRTAYCHGVTRAVRNLLYNSDKGVLPIDDVADRVGEQVAIVRTGVQNQHNGDDPWLAGKPWVRLTEMEHPHADEIADPDGELSDVDAVEITASGQETVEKDVTEVDPAYQTGVGPGAKRRSV